MTPSATSLAALIEPIGDGCRLGLPADYSGVAMAATHALIARGVRDLDLFCLPTGTLQADLLIGAGCVRRIEAAAVTLGEAGLAPSFTRAAQERQIGIVDSTCPALHAALQASEKGVPFMPLRGLIGTDILKHHPDWQVIDNPFEADDPIVVVPAVAPDVALFHAPMADEEGNVWIGRRRELTTLAHAARTTLVTVEEVRAGSFYEDETLAAGVLAGFYVERIAIAPEGARPLGLGERYTADLEHLKAYAKLARDPEELSAYLAAGGRLEREAA